MLFAVRRGLISISFNSLKYNRIVADLQAKVNKLEALGAAEEKKAAAFLNAHLNATDLAAKARKTATNIGNLFG